jgi:hypothetical protein
MAAVIWRRMTMSTIKISKDPTTAVPHPVKSLGTAVPEVTVT